MVDKSSLSERDICTKLITPALEASGWDIQRQVLEEVSFTDGKIYVKGKLTGRGARKRADYILYYKPNIPIAIIEAKVNTFPIGSGIQQALDYSKSLEIPFVFSSNGDGFLFHDKTSAEIIETEIGLENFPSPDELWRKYCKFKGIVTPEAEKIISQEYFFDGSGRKPRYYQQVAINKTIEAIARGQNRILLVMATGTGKTYTAFQIIHRLWKSKTKKRILFLADRKNLIDQTKRGDFKHFKDKMTVVKNRNVDKSYEIYLALYQGLSGPEEERNIYKQFTPEFFDLIIVDECHRGSAREDSSWHEILNYFASATQIGMTATPKETNETSNVEYFGDPIYTYSLKQGIDDGFLAPYRVVRIGLNVDLEGWRPPKGYLDKTGNPVEDRIYNRMDFDKKIVVDERREKVAKKIMEFIKGNDPMGKTIVFCCDIEHAGGMRQALINEAGEIYNSNEKYIMQITGDNDEGKRELDNFIDPDVKYPVIVTTSELMTTGVDAQTCKVIVLDSNIQSMTKFKQIIGRGTRINEDFDKLYFTILDFRNATDLFADKDFDGDPIRVKPVTQDQDLSNVENEEEENNDSVIDEISGEEVIIKSPEIRMPENISEKPRKKVYVNGVDVSILISREVYFDKAGNMITVSLKAHSKEIIREKFSTLNDFIINWNSAEQKTAIIEELKEQGVLIDELQKAVGSQADLFDLICYLGYDQPPLTRKERANNVKKRNVFAKYGEQARRVLEALLEKYADEGIANIESMEVLKVTPLTEFGSPTEIVKEFGGKKKYLEALRELASELYKAA